MARLVAFVVAMPSCSIGVDGAVGQSFGSGWSAGMDADGATTTGATSSDDAEVDASGSSGGFDTTGPSGATEHGDTADADPGDVTATTRGSTSTAAQTDDGGSTSAADACAAPDVVDGIESLFFDCGGGGRVGQGDPLGGVTCEQVCCVFGYAGCVSQASQNVPFFCVPEEPAPIGDCSDVFPNNWTYQCVCS